MKKYKLVVLIAIVVLIVVAFSTGFYYKYQISPVSRDSEKVMVEIKAGSVSSIGDTLYDVNGANYTGIACVGVSFGFGKAEDLKEAGAVAIVDDLMELPEVLKHL